MKLKCCRCKIVMESRDLDRNPCTDWLCPVRAQRMHYAELLGQHADALSRRIARDTDKLLARLLDEPRVQP